jgi:hypothetical protein
MPIYDERHFFKSINHDSFSVQHQLTDDELDQIADYLFMAFQDEKSPECVQKLTVDQKTKIIDIIIDNRDFTNK